MICPEDSLLVTGACLYQALVTTALPLTPLDLLSACLCCAVAHLNLAWLQEDRDDPELSSHLDRLLGLGEPVTCSTTIVPCTCQAGMHVCSPATLPSGVIQAAAC